jgi:transcriptional regulator with XRE-family HTH domain
MYCAPVSKTPKAQKASPPEKTLVGLNLERLLEKHKISQGEVARRTNGAVSQPDMSRIISGETPDPGASKLRAIAAVLNESMAAYWADPTDPGQMERSLKAFVDSKIVSDLSEQDIIDLSSSRWKLGGAPPAVWFHALQIVRLERGAK